MNPHFSLLAWRNHQAAGTRPGQRRLAQVSNLLNRRLPVGGALHQRALPADSKPAVGSLAPAHSGLRALSSRRSGSRAVTSSDAAGLASLLGWRSRLEAGFCRRQGLTAVLVACLLLPGLVLAQSQFRFDRRGNLLEQSGEIATAPQILAQPQSQVVAPGALASFLVVAANTRGLSYQWQFNGTNLAGATGDALLLTNVGFADAGEYSVVLTNPSGSVTSAPATLMLETDGDGLPDAWELTYFGNLNQLPTGDFDGDGISNLDEYLDGTNPADPDSARYPLAVFAHGGQVSVSPNRFSFMKGEVATLTATAAASGAFHAWIGDTNSTANPLSLVMDGPKSLTAIFAHPGAYAITWTNQTNGNWHDASNWEPNVVPAPNDSVLVVSNVTITIDQPAVCGSLTLGSSTSAPWITGSGTLTLTKSSTWHSGNMEGPGTTIVPGGVTLIIANPAAVYLSGRTLDNAGTVVWTGNTIQLSASALITNRAGAVFEARNAAPFGYASGAPRFDNAGIFRKTAAGTTAFNGGGVAFRNYGRVEVAAGTLFLAGGGVNEGTLTVAAPATLELGSDTFTASPASSITGAGQLRVSAGTHTLAGLVNLSGNHTFSGGIANLTGQYICTNNTLTISGGTANCNGTDVVTPAVLNLSGGALGGSSLVMPLGAMTWSGGSQSGSGRTVIPAEVTLTVANPAAVYLSGRTLDNAGTVVWTGNTIQLSASALITNRAGAVFEARNAAPFGYASGAPRFDNAGTFRKTAAGTTAFNGGGVAFRNYGTLEILAGIVSAAGGYTTVPNARLHCALGGTTPGTGHGQLQVSGTVTLNGTLSVDLNPGYLPAVGDTFTLLTAGTRSGTFAAFTYPSNLVTMQLSNTANSVLVRVTEVLAVPPPVLLAPELLGAQVRLTWTAVSNRTYQVEFNPDLNPTNWTPLPGDFLVVSNTASVLDSLTISNRFYRVRVLP
jgi:hypothetical protein